MGLSWARRERTVRLRHHAVLAPAVPSDQLLSVGVGPRGEAVAAWSCRADGTRSRRGGPPLPGRITTHGPGLGAVDGVDVREMPEVRHVQPLPDGRFLLVGARCDWHPAGADRNATVVDAGGAVVATAAMGDGITGVLTTPSGAIWVGYGEGEDSDTNAWDGPGPARIGLCGIARWTAGLDLAWRYPGGADLGEAEECSALNVVGETAWTYHLGHDFEIACIRDDTASIEVRTVMDRDDWYVGGSTLVVDGTSAALVRHEDEDQGAGDVVLGELADGAFQPTARARLRLTGGRPLATPQLVGRGPELHAFVGNDWYRADLTHLA